MHAPKFMHQYLSAVKHESKIEHPSRLANIKRDWVGVGGLGRTAVLCHTLSKYIASKSKKWIFIGFGKFNYWVVPYKANKCDTIR